MPGMPIRDHLGLTELGMVLEAREVLLAEGAPLEALAANQELIDRYSGATVATVSTYTHRRRTGAPNPTPYTTGVDYAATGDTDADSDAEEFPAAPARTYGPSPKQEAFAERLCAERLDPDTAATMMATLRAASKRKASAIIDALLAMPRPDRPTPQAAAGAAIGNAPDGRPRTNAECDALLPDAVPAGTYGIDGRAIRIDRPTRGRYAGRVFISERSLEDAGREIARITNPDDKHALMTRIAADPLAHMIAYGKITGVCGQCHTRLSDPESVERGIGPVCEGKMGGAPRRRSRSRKSRRAAGQDAVLAA